MDINLVAENAKNLQAYFWKSEHNEKNRIKIKYTEDQVNANR